MADLDHGRDIVYVAKDTLVYVLMFPRPLPSLVESQTLSRAFESMLASFEFIEETCRPANAR
ncbi:MAG TPA: hypothetical protein VJY35_10290 [Candidatus Eisenbacteria bacterium]|nr:hypothetical protein [Candidatus Eisenbacteria bacterium]